MTVLSVRRARPVAGSPSTALRFLPLSAFVVDGLMVATAVILAVLGRVRLRVFEPTTAEAAVQQGLLLPVVGVAWLALIALAGGYSAGVFGAGTDEYKRVLRGTVLAAGGIGVACYLAEYPLSRGFFVLAFGVGIPALVLGRFGLRRLVYRARVHGALRHRVLVVGTPGHIDEIARVLQRESWLGYEVIGALAPELNGVETPGGVPLIGDTSDVTAATRAAEADLLFFAGGAVDSPADLRRIAWSLEQDDVQVVVAPSVSEVSGGRFSFRPVGGLPLIHVDPPRAGEASRWGKRLFDVVGSLGLMVLFSPVFVVAALRIRLDDTGPVLFRQQRVGRGGEHFSCLKFRSMVVDAEERLAELHAQYGYESGLFKLKDDPRITKAGRWLRKYSFDELPQLANVLRGEMSLVGPRPPLPLEVASYERDAERRLDVRPGLTGLWQVSGRADLSWEETIRLDLYYVDNWSMVQDLSILLKTARQVVRPTGAY